MIIEAARLAFGRLLTPEFRGVFFKSVGLTVLLLILAWLGLREIFSDFVLPWIGAFFPEMPGWTSWFGFFANIFVSMMIAFALAVLIAPVTALMAGLFLDDVAEVVEKTDYPADPPGKAVPTVTALVLSVKFLGIVILANIVALLLLLVPGINIAAFFIVNGYLLGREFFEFAAMRFRSEADARALYRQNSGTVFLAGLVIAGFLMVPLLNLLTPLFAGAMMVHLHKAISVRAERKAAARATPASASQIR